MAFRKYMEKSVYIKRLIREYVHENAALCSELEEVHINIISRKEECKYLLRKLCEYDSKVATEVQNVSKSITEQLVRPPLPTVMSKKRKKRLPPSNLPIDKSKLKIRKPSTKMKQIKSRVAPRVITMPLKLGKLTVHSLGKPVLNSPECFNNDTLYPIGYVASRTYASVIEPSTEELYKCKITSLNGITKFIIESIDPSKFSVVAESTDICHKTLLHTIGKKLTLVSSFTANGDRFFGIGHPIVQREIRVLGGNHSSPITLELSKGRCIDDDDDPTLTFSALQKHRMMSIAITPELENIVS